MSLDVHKTRKVKLLTQSRDIVKEILAFGVTEDQKLDIIYFLSLELENNDAMKDITKLLKKYRETINKTEDDNKVIEENNKKILTS